MDETGIIRLVAKAGGRVSENISEISSEKGAILVSVNEMDGISVNGAWSGSFDFVDDLYVMSDGSVSQDPTHDHVMVISPKENSGPGPDITFDVIGVWQHRTFSFEVRDGRKKSGVMVLLPKEGRVAA